MSPADRILALSTEARAQAVGVLAALLKIVAAMPLDDPHVRADMRARLLDVAACARFDGSPRDSLELHLLKDALDALE